MHTSRTHTSLSYLWPLAARWLPLRFGSRSSPLSQRSSWVQNLHPSPNAHTLTPLSRRTSLPWEQEVGSQHALPILPETWDGLTLEMTWKEGYATSPHLSPLHRRSGLWKVLGRADVCLTNEIWWWRMAGTIRYLTRTFHVRVTIYASRPARLPLSGHLSRLGEYLVTLGKFIQAVFFFAPTSKVIKVSSRCSKFHFSLSSSNLNTNESEQIAADTANHVSIELMTFWEIISHS